MLRRRAPLQELNKLLRENVMIRRLKVRRNRSRFGRVSCLACPHID